MGLKQCSSLCLYMLKAALCVILLSFFLMSVVRIGSLNINGARDAYKRALLFELIRQKKIDVMFIQETHSDVLNETDWRREWEGVVVCSHMSSSRGGVAVLFATHFTPVSFEVKQEIAGRLIFVRAQFEKFNVVFINVYAPNSGNERVCFLNNLNEILQSCNSDEYVFLGGDFNCTENCVLDRNHVEPHTASSRTMRTLIETHKLCDIWRRLNGNDKQYTWLHARENFISLARLDRFYCFKYHFNIVKSCVISPSGFSDHAIVICKVFISNIRSKSAYWHFNVSLLSDAKFKEVFRFFWKEFKLKKKCFINLKQWWDVGKVETKLLCQQYTFNVSKNITQKMKELEEEIVEVQTILESTGGQNGVDVLKSKRMVLANLLGVKAKGALVRSRYQNLTQMDAPSKFFFNLERKNGQSRYIHSLRSENGQELTVLSEIRQRAVKFYKDLYGSEYKHDEEMSSSFYQGLPKLPKKSKEALEKPLCAQELWKALQTMESGKAPGIDGLPTEFYKAFWEVLGEDFLDVLNESIAEGLLPVSCRRAVITLLPKKGDLQEIKNWRPVSLLCSDLKIFSKTLANRLREVMGDIIHPDQTYCVPGRCISDNIFLVRDVMEVAGLLGIDLGLISIDQEKAFDRVEHQYLWNTLDVFGFGPGFIGVIKVLYKDIESMLKINGGLSAPFSVNRGIRQGCALSGMLYSLAIEPLLNKLRSNIEGLLLPNVNLQHQISAYADDVMIMVNGQNDINTLVKIIQEFGNVSAAKINWSKSDALIVGKWEKGPPLLPGGLTWKKGGLKYLGVFIGDAVTQEKNWFGVIEKIEGRLKKWKWIHPQLSFRGRVLIINNLAASTLWHRLVCVDPPSGLLSRLQAMLVDFFWDRLHWVPQSILFLPLDEGGQGLVHLFSRLGTFRLQFIQRLLTGPEDLVWRKVAQNILQRIDGLGLDSTLVFTDHKQLNFKGLPSFYHGLFKMWGLFSIIRVCKTESLFWLLEEPLVKGSRFDLSNECLPGLSLRLCGSGLVKLRNLIDVAGPHLSDALALADILGQRSVRQTEFILKLWKKRLTEEEITMLQSFADGSLIPDTKDPFPKVAISPDMRGMSSILLDIEGLKDLDLSFAGGKELYRCFVKILNKGALNQKKDTSWREKCGLREEDKPVWRVLYKPPLNKQSGDLQWRILHGAIAVNAFVSVINSDVVDKCVFCGIRETVFHCFTECFRLGLIFALLKGLFLRFQENFSTNAFILGLRYCQKQRIKWQLINFIVGQAKFAIYVTRRNRIENRPNQDAVILFKAFLRARVSVEFKYYQLMNDLESFELQWCFNNIICVVIDGELIFDMLLI